MSNAAIQQAKKLLRFAEKNQTDKIYRILNDSSPDITTKMKGDIFEYFIAGLYEGLGYHAKVGGGKDDKGADVILYKGHHSQKAEIIIQAKNYKNPVSKDTLRTTYIKFFGDHFSGEAGCAQLYRCKRFIIIALNGFIQNADKFSPPKGYSIQHYDWDDLCELIATYAKQRTTRRQNYLRWAWVILLLGIVLFGINRCTHTSTTTTAVTEQNSETLTPNKVRRLHNTPNAQAIKKECARYHFDSETCPEQLVHAYRDEFGSGKLEVGLQVYFCGISNFKKGMCDKSAQKNVEYVLEAF